MSIHNALVSFRSNRNFDYIFLAFFCFCGSAVGVVVSHYADPCFFPLLRSAAGSPVSIVDLPIMILLPCLITAAISFLEKPFLLLPFVFLKSLTFTLTLSSARIAFGSAGWLISCLMLHSNCICIFFLFWYSVRHISGFRSTAANDLLFVFVISLSSGLADSYLVSPFLAAIINS